MIVIFLRALSLRKSQEVVANAVQNETISPRTAFMDLTSKVMSDPGVGPSGLLHLPKPINGDSKEEEG